MSACITYSTFMVLYISVAVTISSTQPPSHLFCQRPRCYHSASKTHVRDRIFKLRPIHTSVIYQNSLNSVNSCFIQGKLHCSQTYLASSLPHKSIVHRIILLTLATEHRTQVPSHPHCVMTNFCADENLPVTFLLHQQHKVDISVNHLFGLF